MKGCVVFWALTPSSSFTIDNIKRFLHCQVLTYSCPLLLERIKRDTCSVGPLGGALILLKGHEVTPDLFGPWSDGATRVRPSVVTANFTFFTKFTDGAQTQRQLWSSLHSVRTGSIAANTAKQ